MQNYFFRSSKPAALPVGFHAAENQTYSTSLSGIFCTHACHGHCHGDGHGIFILATNPECFSPQLILPSFDLLLYVTLALLFPLHIFCSCIHRYIIAYTIPSLFLNCNLVYKNHFVPLTDILFLELFLVTALTF